MKGRVALYGFGGGSGGTGAALTVNAPAGVTVTVSKDGKSKKKTANSSGIAVFKGLSTGEWTVTITDGEKTASKPVTIISDFNKTITFFSATIHVTYPAGSTCTATDGVTTLTAPDKSGAWDCVVPNAGTWTITAEGYPYPSTVDITTNGQVENVDLTRVCLFKDGNQYTDVTGGWTVNGGYTHKLSGSNKPTNGGTATVSDVIYMKAGDGKSQSLSHTKMIDVTKYSKIEYVENTTGSVSSIYVTKNRTGNYSSITLAKISASPGDISGISGEVYFVISTANGRESTFNDIYLVV